MQDSTGRGMPTFSCSGVWGLLVAGLVAISTNCVRGTTSVVWTNGSGNTLYNTAANWSTNVVPNGDYAVTVGTPAPTVLNTDATLTSLDLTAGADFRITNGQSLSLTLGRTMVLAGSITINPEGSAATTALNLPAFDLTLTGGGEIVLNSDTSSINSPGAFLNLPVGMDIRGRGTINTVVQNSGTILADQNGGTLVLQKAPGNGGTIKATNGATISLPFNGTLGGKLIADNGTFRVGSVAGLLNANLNTANGGEFDFIGTGTGAKLTTCTNNGTAVVQANALVTISSSLTNNGTVNIGGSGSTPTGLISSFDMTFNGTGQIVLQSQNASTISNSSFITNGAGHTIRGVGAVSENVLFNNGTIAADQSSGTLAVTGQLSNTNAGIVSVSSGATLTATQLTNTSAINIAGGGTLTAGTFTNDYGPISLGVGGGSGVLNVQSGGLAITTTGTTTGSLLGTGTLNAAVTLSSGATIAPGTSTSGGSLTINGDLIAGAGTHLAFDIGGTTAGNGFDTLFDQTANFGGLLDVSLVGAYLPSVSDSFVVINSAGVDTGSFTNVQSGQRLTTTDGLGSFLVTYPVGSSTVTLSNFKPTVVPEPASILGAGLSTLLLARRRSRRVGPKPPKSWPASI